MQYDTKDLIFRFFSCLSPTGQDMLTLLVICLVIHDQNIISRALCKAVRQTGSRVYLSSYWRCVVNFSGPKGFLIVYCLHLHIVSRMRLGATVLLHLS